MSWAHYQANIRVKLVGKKHGRNSSEHCLWRDFLHMSPDARQNEETTFRVGEIIFRLLMDQGLMFRICQ